LIGGRSKSRADRDEQRIKVLETPVVENEQFHAAQCPLNAGIATIAPGEIISESVGGIIRER